MCTKTETIDHVYQNRDHRPCGLICLVNCLVYFNKKHVGSKCQLASLLIEFTKKYMLRYVLKYLENSVNASNMNHSVL